MFCPNAADWGNVADWVAGIATILAVIAALGIAINEGRRAKAAERALVVKDGERRNATILEAIRLSYEAIDACGMHAGSEAYPADRERYIAGQNRLASALRDLQSVASQYPSIFVEIGRLATLIEPRADPNNTTEFWNEARLLPRVVEGRIELLEMMRTVYDEADGSAEKR